MSDQGKPITRRDLPAVVRRAAELAASDDDVDEELPEQEVIRIAAELGLEARHVRQALYEGVREEAEPGFLDREMGAPRIIATRAVPLDPVRARKAIEDYLVTCEYLQLVRRQDTATTFEPAVDTVSKIARSFRRSSKHQLANALGVDTSVRALEPGWSHVRLRAVYNDDRRARLTWAIIGGSILGVPTGGLVGALVVGVSNGLLIPEMAAALGGVAGISAAAGVVAAYVASIRTRYRKWRERTETEAAAILDRLEEGDDLRPPPAPWVRKLQMKFDTK